MMDSLLLTDLTTELAPAVRFQRLIQALREEFSCGAVALLKKEDEVLRPVAVAGLVRETLGRHFRVAQHPRLATLLSSREPVIFDPHSNVPDPYDGLLDSLAGEPLPVHDCMGVSLYVDGQQWGVLTLDSLVPGTFGPQSADQLKQYTLLIETFIRVTRLEQERMALRSLSRPSEHLATPASGSEIITRDSAISQLLHELDVVAQSDLPLLLLGETGVGKELFARFVHQHSRRRKQPMIHINCAALPESLAESELFGHVRGAFSGATQDRPGKFEAAQGGTLFLDEVGELPLNIQAKLLRVLQSGEIQRLGSDATHQVDVRIVAATNRHLQEGVRNGSFRADLYHRLSVYPVPIPPLRERREDLLLLAGHFLELNRARLGVRCLRLSAAAEAALLQYDWPGNVRELEHVISRAALKTLARQGRSDDSDWITLEPEELDLQSSKPPDLKLDEPSQTAEVLPLKHQVESLQRQAIRQALEQTQGSWSAAARLLDLDSSNLHKLARRLGIK
ncbi:nitric oxide reductase transcriptional regulator NorR [Marinospirillum alkaliphilum]|uniref:Anaerobic nitric oxide reductase transcription regulator n=1 Tax=Marinospirillum alkaliphilum DSM 21637 TaxID=1122209 RepID=A0A1K1TCF7_9GAMM|nr:nitric oxide reductase transcriptional regulator NorR [Marinospirillum alkaliphilum]SFW98021.1 anaerobic nitric oxide reductase transcription regulator [Marinospirillum alkaliphilum DSM 21637]